MGGRRGERGGGRWGGFRPQRTSIPVPAATRLIWGQEWTVAAKLEVPPDSGSYAYSTERPSGAYSGTIVVQNGYTRSRQLAVWSATGACRRHTCRCSSWYSF